MWGEFIPERPKLVIFLVMTGVDACVILNNFNVYFMRIED